MMVIRPIGLRVNQLRKEGPIMERIFFNDNELQVFGPKGDLWLEIEDPEQFSSKDLKMLCKYEPTKEEKPLRITIENASVWKEKLMKIRNSHKTKQWSEWSL